MRAWTLGALHRSGGAAFRVGGLAASMGCIESLFLRHLPPPALRPFVAQAVGFRVPAQRGGVHRGLPSRHVTLVVDLDQPLRVSGRRSVVSAHAVVGGLDTSPVLVDASAPQEGIQYALTALGTHALLGVPAGAIAGLNLDLGDVAGTGVATLLARLHEASGWPERLGRVDDLLRQHLRAVRGPTREVAEAWRVIFAAAGRVRVEAVADHVGWSRRHLSERFRVSTGLTPRAAIRLARFERARRLLLAPGRRSLADLALDAGYADQAHLAREWHGFAGCSIGTWLREELPFVQDGMAAHDADSDA